MSPMFYAHVLEKHALKRKEEDSEIPWQERARRRGQISVGCTPHPTISIIGTIIIDRDYSPFALEISMLAYDHFIGQNDILRWEQKERYPCIKKPDALMSKRPASILRIGS